MHAIVPGAVVEILQPVERQLAFPPPVAVVTLTVAEIVAPPVTVSDAAGGTVVEFAVNVTEVIVRESVNAV